MKPVVNHEHLPTIHDYVLSDSFVSGLKGPVGSGKTLGSCTKIMRHASEMPPDNRGYRRSRWAVIRNTYPELKTTTVKTWEDWFSEVQVPPIVYDAPIRHQIKIAPTVFKWLDKATGQYSGVPGLDLEVWFIALDRPADIKRLKSLELTAAFINEASEVAVVILEMLTARVGRYPKRGSLPAGDYWCGIIYDTNAADETCWTEDYEANTPPKIEVELEDGTVFEASWSFYNQPMALLEVQNDTITEKGHELFGQEVKPTKVMHAAGRSWTLNPGAENLPNLKPGYYHQQITNKGLDWIQRYIQVKRVYIAEGKPWIPEFSQVTMVKPVKFNPDLSLYCGIDIGGGTLNPAAVWGQVGQLGDWRILSELVIPDIGLERFMPAFFLHQAQVFQGKEPEGVFLDPAAATRDPVYEIEIKNHLIRKGLPARLAPTNDIKTRRECTAAPMSRVTHLPDGSMRPSFLVDPSCKKLIAGLAGKWCKKEFERIGGKAVDDKPVKNEYSNPCDALGYLVMGAGEHAVLLRGRKPGQTVGTLQQRVARGENIRIQVEHDI